MVKEITHSFRVRLVVEAFMTSAYLQERRNSQYTANWFTAGLTYVTAPAPFKGNQ